MTSTFETGLREQLLTGAHRLRRRRRRQHRALATVGVASVALASLGLAVRAASDGGATDGVAAGPGRSDSPPATGAPPPGSASTDGGQDDPVPPVTYPLPGGPSLTGAQSRGAVALVEDLLAAVRADDLERAARYWTRYPDEMGAPPDQADAEAVPRLRQLGADHPWLLTAEDLRFAALPAPSAGPVAEPVVTVEATLADGARRAAAFVLTVPAAGEEMRVQRLPAPAAGVRPVDGATLAPGDRVSFATFPVEGGARAFLDGTEVTSIEDVGTRSVIVEVPDDAPAGFTLTLVVATPEVPDVVVASYRVDG